MACVIEQVRKPTLIISHNKTLAAQLYEEMRELFPHNAVSYFVSYYDYYQPEAYIPQRDIYIEKDASRNDDLDRLRLAATSNLLSRRDVIVVASVSCIYGLGSPEDYRDRVLTIARRGHDRPARAAARPDRHAVRAERVRAGARAVPREGRRDRGLSGVRAVRGADRALRRRHRPARAHSSDLRRGAGGGDRRFFIFPAVHYVHARRSSCQGAGSASARSWTSGSWQLRQEGKLLEAQRLLARTKYDLEMIEEVGYCSGIENYSAHLEGRRPAPARNACSTTSGIVPGREPDDWLLFIDESHVTIPQIRAMFNGDRARKQTLVDHGFRLPSALDNRPLTFEEFEEIVPQVVYVSATPGPYELEQSEGVVVEQVIRPTGLLDPRSRCARRAGRWPTSSSAAASGRSGRARARDRPHEAAGRGPDELPHDQGSASASSTARSTRSSGSRSCASCARAQFDVLVGVNLLREGLDLPEVSLVAIVDADKTGFLRSATSLVQTIGRAARNVNAHVVMYADDGHRGRCRRRSTRRRAGAREAGRVQRGPRHHRHVTIDEGHPPRHRTRAQAAQRTARRRHRRRRSGRTVLAVERDELIAELEKEMLRGGGAPGVRTRGRAVAGPGHRPPGHDPSRRSGPSARKSSRNRRRSPAQARSKAGITPRSEKSR